MSLPDFSTQAELFSTAGLSASLFAQTDRYRLFAKLVYPPLAAARSTLARLRGLEGVTLRNPLKINAATSKVGTTNSLAGVHDLERKSWVVVAPATPV